MTMVVHKDAGPASPRLSIILLDWGVRERFTTLDWLLAQNVPKDQYELIWIELFDRVIPEVIEKADLVINCNQRGKYHKHKGYNIGVLRSRGDLVCICDSDAVFPPDFVESVFRAFGTDGGSPPIPLVLMHHEWRTSFLYPDDLSDTETLKDQTRWKWWPLVHNAGACMTVRRADAIRFGGFDECDTLAGYLCGPYDLGWRLVNAGYPEVWHDESVALWHFAHPDPIGTNGQKATLGQLLEKAYPHVHGHALTAVEAFSTGRFQPLKENEAIWKMRMADRRIGSELETRYSNLTGQDGYRPSQVRRMWVSLYREIAGRYLASRLYDPFRRALPRVLGERAYGRLKAFYRDHVAVYRVKHDVLAEVPVLLCSFRGYNIVRVKNHFFAARHGIGDLDLTTEEGRRHPELVRSDNYRTLIRSLRRMSSERA